MFIEHLTECIGQASAHGLDDVMRTIYRGVVAGSVSEADAERLENAVQARRAVLSAFHAARTGNARPRRSVRDPARIERRRRLAASGPLPPALASAFSTGELAALRICVDEIRDHGICDKSLNEIGRRAGVSKSTVRNALREAQRRGLLNVQERRKRGQASDTNVITVTSPEVRTWIAFRKGRAQKFGCEGNQIHQTPSFGGPNCRSKAAFGEGREFRRTRPAHKT